MKKLPPPTVAPASAAYTFIPAAISNRISSIMYGLLLLSIGYYLGFLATTSFSSPSPYSSSPSVVLLSSPPRQSQITKYRPPPSPPPPKDLLRFRTECADPVSQRDVLKTILDKVYNETSPYDGFPSPATAELILPPAEKLRGWGSTTPVFRHLIESVRPLTIIELGTFLGASALHMAAVTANLSLPAVILCIDDFRGWPGVQQLFHKDLPRQHQGDALLLQQFMAGVVTAGEEGRVVPLPFSTSSALAALCEWGVYGDLIEVDAGHDFHSAWSDINMAYAVLRPGGVMFGHDYFTKADDRGVRRAVTLFAKEKGLQVRPDGQHWVLSPKPPAPVS